MAPASTDLSKLTDVVKNKVVKKDVYAYVYVYVHIVDTSNLVKKADFNTKIGELEKKKPDQSQYIITPEFN